MKNLGWLKLRSPMWVWTLFLVGIFLFTARLVLDSSFAGIAFLYLAIPFMISVLLHQFDPQGNDKTLWRQYVQHMSLATIIMLATSALLFEGFLCVLMFLPIYWLSVSFGYLFSYLWMKSRSRNYVHILPLIVLVLSMEGVSPLTSQSRVNSITYTVVAKFSAIG